ncbi:hypothetical protein FA95DRAFT_1565168 [Auriscalpium vulgare]|uniref:Uncharacterized protein n=1 Tax=Auriscalpium vulgare TaxID=40419 RepID=A0ACB8RC21_9AGAM|nr:hypothetical protein FA95DRAFT_1565168 [Auriscalpium vulgare]
MVQVDRAIDVAGAGENERTEGKCRASVSALPSSMPCEDDATVGGREDESVDDGVDRALAWHASSATILLGRRSVTD